MNHPKPSLNGSAPLIGASSDIPFALKEMLKGGLSLLWRSYEYARDLEAKGWEFAVDCDDLYQAGWSDIDFRWLIARAYVEFAPKSAPIVGQKPFPETDRPFAGKNSCFILTEAGAALAMQVLSRPPPRASQAPIESGKVSPHAEFSGYTLPERRSVPQKPSWDRDRKVLRCGDCIIKQFRWAAVNQETILMAFEEEAWPARIDDPLPQKLNQDAKSRLHDTIKCLNRNHRKRLIRFSGDGTGEGVLWMFLDADATES